MKLEIDPADISVSITDHVSVSRVLVARIDIDILAENFRVLWIILPG